MRILAYRTSISDSKVLIEESTGSFRHSNDLRQLFAFLLEEQGNDYWQPQFDRCIRVCWELDATVAPILKLLGKELCINLHKTHKCRWMSMFDLFYVLGKIFNVTYIPRKDRMSLYELAQYYPELDEPEELLEVQMLGETLLYELKKMGLEPTKLTSPVAIYEECVMRYLDLPKLSDMPREVAEFAYQCSGRLWIECFQTGYWK